LDVKLVLEMTAVVLAKMAPPLAALLAENKDVVMVAVLTTEDVMKFREVKAPPS
jgi:hypothetical protein